MFKAENSILVVNRIKTFLVYMFFYFLLSICIFWLLATSPYYQIIFSVIVAVFMHYLVFYRNRLFILKQLFYLKQIPAEDSKTLSTIEEIYKTAMMKQPIVYISDLKVDLFFQITITNQNYLIISRQILNNIETKGIKFLCASSAYRSSIHEDQLYSTIIFTVASPILLLDLIAIYLKNHRFFLLLVNVSRIIISTITTILIRLFIPRNLASRADYGASKILKSTEGFVQTLQSIDYGSSIDSRLMPYAFSIIACTKSSIKSFAYQYFTIQEELEIRIMLIKSFIG